MKRFEYMDIAKGICMLLIIIGHVGIGKMSMLIYSFHVPCFFIISGYLFKKNKNIGEFIKKKTKRLIIPYIFAAIIIIIYKYCISGFSMNSLLECAQAFLLQKRYTTLWFLTVLYIGIIIFNFNCNIFEKNKFMLGFCSIGLSLIGYLYIFIAKKSFWWNIDLAIFIQVFLYIGYCLRKLEYFERITEKNEIIKKMIIYMILGELLTACNYLITKERFDMFYNEVGLYFLSVPSAILCSISVILLSKIIKIKFLKYVGENSMVYFLFHQSILISIADLIMRNLETIINLGKNYDILVRIFQLAIVLIGSNIFVIIIDKLNIGPLVGKSKKYNQSDNEENSKNNEDMQVKNEKCIK